MRTTRKIVLNPLLHILPMVIDVKKMKEVFVISHVPNKTDVFISSDSASALQDLILKPMTQTVNLLISGKIPCEDILNSLNLWYLCKI